MCLWGRSKVQTSCARPCCLHLCLCKYIHTLFRSRYTRGTLEVHSRYNLCNGWAAHAGAFQGSRNCLCGLSNVETSCARPRCLPLCVCKYIHMLLRSRYTRGTLEVHSRYTRGTIYVMAGQLTQGPCKAPVSVCGDNAMLKQAAQDATASPYVYVNTYIRSCGKGTLEVHSRYTRVEVHSRYN